MISTQVLATIIETLKLEDKAALGGAFGALGAELEQADVLLRRYGAAAEVPASPQDLFLASWMVATVGPQLKMDGPAAFEFILAERLKQLVSPVIVSPKWVLATPIDGALYRRMPCRPLVPSVDPTLTLAYDGLLEHLLYLGELRGVERDRELLNSSLPWRVVALADRLEPDPSRTSAERERGMSYRLGLLRNRVQSDLSSVEKLWWSRLNDELVDRRNVLSHLCELDPWTFERCVSTPWDHEAALEAGAAIALAIVDQIARDLRTGEAPVSLLERILQETVWLEEFA